MEKVAEKLAERIEVLEGKRLAAKGTAAERYRNQVATLRAQYRNLTGQEYV
jgi:hypothetical protein